jgi:MFS superfamily sulfate permease-like transporter
MLAVSGIELSLVTRDQTTRKEATIMLLTAGACLGADIAVGFVLGLLLAWALRLERLFTVERERVTKDSGVPPTSTTPSSPNPACAP